MGGFSGGYSFIHGIILREVNWAWAGISLCFYGFSILFVGGFFFWFVFS